MNFEFESAHELLMNLSLAFAKSMNLNLNLVFSQLMNLNLNLKIKNKMNGSNQCRRYGGWDGGQYPPNGRLRLHFG